MKKIKKPEFTQGRKINTPNEVTITEYQHPIFCFKYLHKDHGIGQCDKDEKASLIETLVTLSSKTWTDLQLAPKHGLGSEKIARDSIKSSIPISITADVTFFLAFRFSGKKPIVGYRNKFVFHIVYIDRDFTVYNHG
jgi:hypothetical protein